MKEQNFTSGSQDRRRLFIGIYAVIILAIVGLASLLQDSSPEEPSLKQILSDRLPAYETDLRDSLDTMETNEDMAAWLALWAENKGLKAYKDGAGNVVYKLSASSDKPQTRPAILVCSYDVHAMEDALPSLTAALAAGKTMNENTDCTILFLSEEDGRPVQPGVFSKVYKEYISDGLEPAVFCLESGTDSRMTSNTGGFQHFRISQKLSFEEPRFQQAYRIALSGIPDKIMNEEMDMFPNPVKVLGSLLAGLKSDGLLFELSSFRGGTGPDKIPPEASMVIVVNDSDTSKLEKKLQSSISRITEDWAETCPDLEYTFEKTETPARVFSAEDTENLISVLYTASSGVYERDREGNVLALVNAGKISVKNSRLRIDTGAMSASPALLAEIRETYQIICGLSGMKCSLKEEISGFCCTEPPEASDLMDSFSSAYSLFAGEKPKKAETVPELKLCSWLHTETEEFPDTMISLDITEDGRLDFAGALVTWCCQPDTQEEL